MQQVYTRQEFDKYEEMWGVSGYHDTSPGEVVAEAFMRICEPEQGATLIDLGCGMGKGGEALEKLGLDVSYLDIIDNHEGRERYLQQSLWQPLFGMWDWGYCCDVMEHIPEQFTMLVVHNALVACKRVFFQISFVPDNFGAVIDQSLHLTVHNFTWWRDSLREIGEVVEARDCLHMGIFLLESPYHES